MGVVVVGAESATVLGVVRIEFERDEFASRVWVVVGDSGSVGASGDDTGAVASQYCGSEVSVRAGGVGLVVYSLGSGCSSVGGASSACAIKECRTSGAITYLHDARLRPNLSERICSPDTPYFAPT